MKDRYHEGYADGKLIQSVEDKASMDRLTAENAQLKTALRDACQMLANSPVIKDPGNTTFLGDFARANRLTTCKISKT